MNGWICFQPAFGNLIAALRAVAELALIHLAKGSADAADLDLSLTINCQCHLLGLKRIHTGQTPDTLLVELNRSPIFRPRISQGE